MNSGPQTVSVEDLVGSTVVSAEGKRLGRVVEIQATTAPEYRVIGLDVGAAAWLFRLHLAQRLARALGKRDRPRTARWEDVDRFERFTVTLKPGRGLSD